jgi:uncharacterized Zn finger protein (UPF0148 family)
MLAFRLGQRVRVTRVVSTKLLPLVGKTGKVVCLSHKTNTAYVDMDEPLPDDKRAFTAKHDSRRNWLSLYPEECEEIQ